MPIGRSFSSGVRMGGVSRLPQRRSGGGGVLGGIGAGGSTGRPIAGAGGGPRRFDPEGRPVAGSTSGGIGASAGYEFDPVKGDYVEQYKSANARNTLSKKLQDLAFQPFTSETSTSATSGTGGATGVPSTVEFPTVQPGAPSEAQDLEFGAAKARAGSMGRASVESLRDMLAEQGILGGGTEARGLTDRLAAATNPLSDINVAQAKEGAETGRQRASQEYSGRITQRGQDIQAAQAQRELETRKQMQTSTQRQQYLQSVLSSLAGSLY